MKFNDYPTIYGFVSSFVPDVKAAGHNKFYETFFADLDLPTQDQARVEMGWIEENRPYYNVWPGIVDAFLKLDLTKVPSRSINYPNQILSLRFAEASRIGEFEWRGEAFWIKSILVSIFDTFDGKTGKVAPGLKTLLAHIDVGENGGHHNVEEKGPVCMWRRFPMFEGDTIQDSLDKSSISTETGKLGVAIPQELIADAFKIIAACGLLEDTSSIIVPDVLNRDKHKSINETIIARAKRNGKVGWNVGKILGDGVSPHFRAPHPALYHVGPGREKTVIRFRTGKGGGPIIINPKKITNVPTGHLGKDNDVSTTS